MKFRQLKSICVQQWIQNSRSGGPNFCRNFLTTFFRHFPKKFQHILRKFHLSPKISDDFFLVIDQFRVLICWFSVGGPNSVAHINQEGQKSLNSHKFTILSLLFLPPRGPNSIANFEGGPWPDLPPLDPPLFVFACI